MDESTARRSAKLGDVAAALVKKARRIRRKAKLVPSPVVPLITVEEDDDVDVDVRRAVKAF